MEETTPPHESAHEEKHTHHHATPHHKNGSFVLTTPIAILLSGALIAAGLMGYGIITKGSDQSAAAAFEGRALDESDFIEGDPKSDVIVIEYSDSECPFCGQIHTTMKQLRETYGKKIAFVYRHFPLTQIHPQALNEAKAMECVGKIAGTKKYYEYIDALFSYKIEKRSMQLPQNGKEELVRSIGVNVETFNACMKLPEITQKIEDSINDGIQAGVEGTPSSFVLVKTRNGYEVVGHVEGARPYAYFKALIDQALSR